MRKAEEDPYSILNNETSSLKLEIDIISDSCHWGALEHNLDEFINKVANYTLSYVGLSPLNKTINLSVLLSDNDRLQELNRVHRNQDIPTDILSFSNYKLKPSNYLQILAHEDEIYLGDLALAYGVIYHDALEQDKSLINHIAHMIVHGLLHLLGYDHENEDEANEMEKLEIEILKRLNIPDPY